MNKVSEWIIRILGGVIVPDKDYSLTDGKQIVDTFDTIDELIIFLGGVPLPKAAEGQVVVKPHVAKSQKGISKPRKIIPVFKDTDYLGDNTPDNGAGSVPPEAAPIELDGLKDTHISKDAGAILTPEAMKCSVEPLPGQIGLDEVLKDVNLPSVQIDTGNVNLQGKMTTTDMDDLWEKK